MKTFRTACSPFDYLPTTTNPITTVLPHEPIKEFIRGIKINANTFPKFKNEKQRNE